MISLNTLGDIMKKLTFATLLALSTLSTAAFAQNWYVQGDVGYSKLKLDGGDNHLTGSIVEPRLSVGYDYGDFRFALDYSHLGKIKDTFSYDLARIDASLKAHSIGLSAIYDFATNSDFTPYVGVRLVNTRLKAEVIEQSPGFFRLDEISEIKTGYGVLGGVQYKLTNNLDLNLGAEYNKLSSDVNHFGVKLGLRVNF